MQRSDTLQTCVPSKGSVNRGSQPHHAPRILYSKLFLHALWGPSALCEGSTKRVRKSLDMAGTAFQRAKLESENVFEGLPRFVTLATPLFPRLGS